MTGFNLNRGEIQTRTDSDDMSSNLTSDSESPNKIESLEIDDDDFVAREDVIQQKLVKFNKTGGNLDDILEESQRTELGQSGLIQQKSLGLTRSQTDMSTKNSDLFDSLVITENVEGTEGKNMQKNVNTASTENFKKKPDTSKVMKKSLTEAKIDTKDVKNLQTTSDRKMYQKKTLEEKKSLPLKVAKKEPVAAKISLPLKKEKSLEADPIVSKKTNKDSLRSSEVNKVL